MALSSPRKDFRGQPSVPLAWPNPREWLVLVSQAIRVLQENTRKHPVGTTTCSTTYTMIDLDSLILAGATAADLSVFLLTATGRQGQVVSVKKTDASENLVVIDPVGSETIDGSSSISLTQQNAVRTMQSDGTNWRLIGSIGNATAL